MGITHTSAGNIYTHILKRNTYIVEAYASYSILTENHTRHSIFEILPVERNSVSWILAAVSYQFGLMIVNKLDKFQG